MAKKLTIETAKIIYNSPNSARHSVSGTTIVPALARSMRYGYRKPGEVFEVAEQDIIARPDLYLAYPCGKPFKIEGKKLVNPCGSRESVIQDVGQLTDIPGVGKKMAERFQDNGIVTKSDVMGLTEEMMFEIKVPPASRTKILEWQASKKESKS